jgi:hypothetical protein
MHFSMKSTLKNNRNHIPKQTCIRLKKKEEEVLSNYKKN